MREGGGWKMEGLGKRWEGGFQHLIESPSMKWWSFKVVKLVVLCGRVEWYGLVVQCEWAVKCERVV